jgi:uncharacterized protein
VVGAEATLPSEPLIAHLDDVLRRFDVRGIKIHPALNFVPPDHDGYGPIYEQAKNAGVVVIAHGGGSNPLYAAEVDYCAAENFVPVLEAHPRLQLVVAHLAHPYTDDLVEMAARFPNLYTDVSLVLGERRMPDNELVGAIRAFGVDRVMFGSDFPYFDPEACLDGLLASELSAMELDAVGAGNAAALFALG